MMTTTTGKHCQEKQNGCDMTFMLPSVAFFRLGCGLRLEMLMLYLCIILSFLGLFSLE